MTKNWNKIKLEEIIDLRYGKSMPNAKRQGGKVPVYGSNGIVGFHNEALINFPTIVIGRKGSVGKANLEKGSSWIIDTAFYTEIKDKNIDLMYLFHFLKNLEKAFTAIGKGVKPGISRDEYLASLISLPYKNNKADLAEQKRIAGKIDKLFAEIDKAIEQTKTALKNSENILRSKSNQFFREKLNNNWNNFYFEEITDIITDFVANGSFASLKENVKYLKNPDFAILLRTRDYSHNFKGPFVYVNKHAYDFLKKSSLREGDIMACNVGSIDTVFRVPKMEKPLTIGPNAILIRSKYSDFLFFYMLSDLYLKRLKTICTKSLQPKFNKTGFRKLQVPFPIKGKDIDFKKQQKISVELNIIKERQKEIEAKYNEQLNIFNKLKQSILNQAFQGKL
jgi:type I restriction enzyme, S subunit